MGYPRRNTGRFVFAYVLVTLSGAAARGGLVIDDFSDVITPSPWPLTITTPTVIAVDETGLSGAIGGRRLTTVSVPFLDLVGLDDVSVSVVSSVGLLDYTSTVGANGDLRLGYVGDFTADLSGDAEIQIDFTGFDLGNVTPMGVTVTLWTGSNAANLTHLLTATGAQTTVFSFSEFTNISLIDLSSVDAMLFEFDPGDGGDFRLGGINSVVPEPTTLVLLLAGAGAIVRRRRRSL